jgi:Biotin-requiring enzyme
VKIYHIRLDGTAGAARLVEVAVEDTVAGVRAAIVRRGDEALAGSRAAGDAAAAIAHWDPVDLVEIIPGWYSLLIGGRSHTLTVAAWSLTGPGGAGGGARRWTLLVDGDPVSADVGRSARARSTAQASAASAGQIRAPMPGLVVAIQAEPGSAVAAGQPLIIMEAMKMQMEIRAPLAGVVREVRVVPGQDVGSGEILATVA